MTHRHDAPPGVLLSLHWIERDVYDNHLPVCQSATCRNRCSELYLTGTEQGIGAVDYCSAECLLRDHAGAGELLAAANQKLAAATAVRDGWLEQARAAAAAQAAARAAASQRLQAANHTAVQRLLCYNDQHARDRDYERDALATESRRLNS